MNLDAQPASESTDTYWIDITYVLQRIPETK